MKIQYASDLHLEMSSNTLNYWNKNRIEPVGDILVLAAFGSGFTWASAIIKW